MRNHDRYHLFEQQLEESRVTFQKKKEELLNDINLLDNLSHSIQRKPLGWLVGSLLSGLLISKLGGRKKNEEEVTKQESNISQRKNLLPQLFTFLTGETSLLLGCLSLSRQFLPTLLPLIQEAWQNYQRQQRQRSYQRKRKILTPKTGKPSSRVLQKVVQLQRPESINH